MILFDFSGCCYHVYVELKICDSSLFCKKLTKTRAKSKAAFYQTSFQSERYLCFFGSHFFLRDFWFNYISLKKLFDIVIQFSFHSACINSMRLTDLLQLLAVPVVLREFLVGFYIVKVWSFRVIARGVAPWQSIIVDCRAALAMTMLGVRSNNRITISIHSYNYITNFTIPVFALTGYLAFLSYNCISTELNYIAHIFPKSKISLDTINSHGSSVKLLDVLQQFVFDFHGFNYTL